MLIDSLFAGSPIITDVVSAPIIVPVRKIEPAIKESLK